jgi:hypothetical protein
MPSRCCLVCAPCPCPPCQTTCRQAFIFLFGAVAVAFAAFGMITVDKSVTRGAFNVLTTITTYATDAFSTLDRLLDTVQGTSGM